MREGSKMRILDAKRKLCYCCMEMHDVKLVDVDERVTYKGVPVEFTARYEYCELVDEFLSDEELINRNDKAMKRKYELMISGNNLKESSKKVCRWESVMLSFFVETIGWW